jgi:hypothetical protein
MAAIVETSDQIAATLVAANAGPATGTFAKRLATWWPAAILVFALVLTLCWNAGLLLLVWWFI